MTAMGQLFKALPRDLQWEILETFVGTHAVRNGKLMRKLILNINDAQYKYSVRERPCYNWIYNIRQRGEENTLRFARFPRNNTYLMCCRDKRTNDTVYLYRKMIQLDEECEFIWQIQSVPDNLPDEDDAIPLEPFEKHAYPSYLFTKNKRRIPLSR